MQLSNFRPKISFLCYTLLEIVIFMINFFFAIYESTLCFLNISTLFCILEDAYTFVKNTCTYWQRYFKNILQRQTLSYFDWHNRKKLEKFCGIFPECRSNSRFYTTFLYIAQISCLENYLQRSDVFFLYNTRGILYSQSIHSCILNCHVPLVDRYWSRTSTDA